MTLAGLECMGGCRYDELVRVLPVATNINHLTSGRIVTDSRTRSHTQLTAQENTDVGKTQACVQVSAFHIYMCIFGESVSSRCDLLHYHAA